MKDEQIILTDAEGKIFLNKLAGLLLNLNIVCSDIDEFRFYNPFIR